MDDVAMKIISNSVKFAWHYTPAMGMAGIMDTGTIRPSTVDIGPAERPAAWFSLNQRIELTMTETAFETRDGRCIRPRNLEEYRILGFGLYRVGVCPSRLLRYVDLLKAAKIGLVRRKVLERIARNVGATPSEWMGHIGAVEIQPDMPIERFDGKAWVPSALKRGASLPLLMDEANLIKPLTEALLNNQKRSDKKPIKSDRLFCF